MTLRLTLILALLGVSFPGCGLAVSPDDGTDSGSSSGTDGGSGSTTDGGSSALDAPLPDAWHPPPPPREQSLDLLLMVDNSNSMGVEQALVAAEIPRFIAILASGDRNADGTQDFAALHSIHIGIVDSDMGIGDVMSIQTCSSGFGDDGILQTSDAQAPAGCLSDYSTEYPDRVFSFTAGDARTSMQFAHDVGCVAQLGTDGCGFEFELESPLKALSLVPSASNESPVSWTASGYMPPVFSGPTYGHGADPSTNGALLRPGSILAILTVNDEDDCSTPNPHIFSPDDPSYNQQDGQSIDLNLRCHVWANQLYPISRYVDGFLGLRAEPSRLVFASITGVPTSLSGASPAAILADPNMLEQLDPAMTNRILPACMSSHGMAFPAIRMTQLAQGLAARGAHTTVQSICNPTFQSAFDALIDQIVLAM